MEKIQHESRQIEQTITYLETQKAKNKSDIEVNNSLIKAQEYKNALVAAEMYLTNARKTQVSLESTILEPKAKAAKTTTAELGHVADNIGKIGKAAWQFLFPSFGY